MLFLMLLLKLGRSGLDQLQLSLLPKTQGGRLKRNRWHFRKECTLPGPFQTLRMLRFLGCASVAAKESGTHLKTQMNSFQFLLAMYLILVAGF